MSKALLIAVILVAVAYWWMRGDNFDPDSIRNKRVLVTGASSGIGEQLAYEYSKLGARLVITARRESLLKTVVQKCRELGAKQVDALPADMSKPEDRTRLVKFVQVHLGGLDQLILNHAIMRMKRWKGDQEDMDILRGDMEVNFVSYVDLASRALPMLIESKGHIGVVSSGAGKLGFIGGAQYCTTKFALQGFFSSLRQELEFNNTGVSVTLCVLGYIDTDAANTLATSLKDKDAAFGQPTSAVDTAKAILKGVTNRVYELYYPFMATIMVTVHHFFPEYTDRYVTSNMQFK